MYLFLIAQRREIGMINKYVKKFLVILLTLTICLSSFVCQTAYAKQSNSSAVIGEVNSNIPYIQVEIKEKDLKADNLNGKLGSENLNLLSVDNLSDQSSITYVLIDNSKSMTQSNISPNGSFEALKKGVNKLIEEKASEKSAMAVYSVGEGDPRGLGIANSEASKKSVIDNVDSLKGNEDATNLNESLEKIFETAKNDLDKYTLVKLLLVTDTSGDYGEGIDLSEVSNVYQFNQIPIYTVCNSIKENSDFFKVLRTFCRNSGGEGTAYFYNQNKSAESTFENIYKQMYSGSFATFTTNTQADNNTRELVISVNGIQSSETVKLNREADITARIKANVKINDTNNAFIFSFVQEGFAGNIPLSEEALKITSYKITKSGKDKPLAVHNVVRNDDGSYTVTMKKDIYTGNYDFSFEGITDLSRNKNVVDELKNNKIEGKNPIFKVLPYIIAVVAVALVLLAFYLILLNLKKKKNVKTIRELFIAQVEETTVEERVYVSNPKSTAQTKVNLYTQTANYPQKHISLNVNSSFIVGRNDICDVYIDDSKMSRQHFAVEYTDGVFLISDLESANGTFVNGIRVKGRQRLNSGDMILAGTTSIRIEY